MDERVWLKHPESGGYFHCPAGATEDWQAMGWEESDPPPAEPSPVVAEHLAWREQQEQEQAEAEAAGRKAKRRGRRANTDSGPDGDSGADGDSDTSDDGDTADDTQDQE